MVWGISTVTCCEYIDIIWWYVPGEISIFVYWHYSITCQALSMKFYLMATLPSCWSFGIHYHKTWRGSFYDYVIIRSLTCKYAMIITIDIYYHLSISVSFFANYTVKFIVILGPFYLYLQVITSIMKCGIKLPIPYQTSTVQSLKFEKG